MGHWQARVASALEAAATVTGAQNRSAPGRARGASAVIACFRRTGAVGWANPSLEHLTQGAGVLRGPAAVGKSYDFEDANRTIERNGNHIAEPHGVARMIDAPAIDANVASGGKRRSIRPRAHYARVPKPFVDALAIQAQKPSARFFVARLESFFERRELREWRIRVGFAAVPVFPTALDVFGTQRRIVIRTVAGRRSAAAIASRRPLHVALRATPSFRARRTTLGPILVSVALRPAGAIELGIAEPPGCGGGPVLCAHS